MVRNWLKRPNCIKVHSSFWFRSGGAQCGWKDQEDRSAWRLHCGNRGTRCQITADSCGYAWLWRCHWQHWQLSTNHPVHWSTIRTLLDWRERPQQEEHRWQSRSLLLLLYQSLWSRFETPWHWGKGVAKTITFFMRYLYLNSIGHAPIVSQG